VSQQGFALLLILVFAAEAGIGILVIRDLLGSSTETQKMYDVSVLGLRRVGEMQYEAQETRLRTLYVLTIHDSDRENDYAVPSHGADVRVSNDIAWYLSQARTPQEIEYGKRLADDWSAYLRIRDQVLGLLAGGGIKEAVSLDLAAGVTSFDRVRGDLDKIKQLYDEQAVAQVDRVFESSRRSIVWLIGGLCLALLLGGVAVWAIQRGKMMGAMQLAKLQMEFVASVSHELRTPIAVILSAGENVRDGLVSEKQDVIQQGSIIATYAGELMDLVDQVLLFSAATTGDTPRNVRPVTPHEILESALKSTSSTLQVAGFQVEQQIEPELPSVMGDPLALSRCLQNLIVNAVKYSAKQRWIGISARVNEAADGRSEVQISVQDHGIGISDADLEKIFDPFYRSPDVMVAQIRGAGLGLSIARRNAEAFGGRLSVTSSVGRGSVFTLHLPVSGPTSPEVATTSQPGVEILK
jgi:signal transduction histidine kinase